MLFSNNQEMVTVEVVPSHKKEKVEELGEHRFKIFVKEPAKNNRANTRVKELLAMRYRISPEKVRIVTGARSPKKRFLLFLDT